MDASFFGLYVHVPYCREICPYCDFNVTARPKPPWDDFARALIHNLRTHAPLYTSRSLRSVYFGGGTPSLAPPRFFEMMLQEAQARFDWGDEVEVTVEVNPGTVDAAWLAEVRDLGVNRLSLGWQSTDGGILKVLGRDHTADESMACFEAARGAGFDNISADLIFAVPEQTMAHLDADLSKLGALKPEHVSLYALTYHAGTPMHRWREKKTVTPCSEEREVAMMERIDAALGSSGFEHYEVSNYAQPTRRAVHNSLYWSGVPYLGVGPGAHSFAHDRWQRGWRWEGARSVDHYIRTWHDAQATPSSPTDVGDVEWLETLTPRQLLNERLLCRMRLSDPTDLNDLPLGEYEADVLASVSEASSRGWLTQEGTRIQPTRLGMQNADALAGLFFT